MNKLILAVVPGFITFGPLFMIMLGQQGYSTGHPIFDHLFSVCGAIMLAVGLAAMFKIITKQQTLIEKLQADLRPSA